jgi:PAS domain S-box-containing protein
MHWTARPERKPMKQDDRPLVLVVDDKPENRRLLQAILVTDNYRVELASDGPMALQMSQDLAPDLILLDVMMPGMDGYEVCRLLKEVEATRNIPVIFVTGVADAEAETWAFAMGGADFITKPFKLPVVLARVRTHLALYQKHKSLEGMFRDVIEFAPDAFVIAETDGTIVQINAQAEQLFGYSRQELLGLRVEALMPASLRSAHEGYRNAYLEQPRKLIMGVGVQCLRKDGTEFPADVNLSPLQTGRGRLLMAVVRDASERKKREEQSQEAARYARSLIEVSPDPMVMIDTRGQITDVNVAAERMTGLSREQLIGSDAASKFTEPERLYRGFQQVAIQGHVSDYPMTIRHISGRLTEVMCNANVYRNQQSEIIGVFASARDMTESRRIQQEIMVSRQRVRELAAQSEAVREEEKKHIAREVHDELGQVLTALRMDLSFLGMQSSPQDLVLMKKIQDMKALVDRAIQGVRNVASNLRPAALDMGLVAAIEWLCTEFTRNTETPCAFHADQASTDLDEAWSMVMFRIVQESLTNITRYAQASSVNVTMERRGQFLWLEVRDNGRGFDPAEVAKKKSYGLLGMRERAIILGGRVKIISAQGQGTMVDVTIPIKFDPSAKDFS